MAEVHDPDPHALAAEEAELSGMEYIKAIFADDFRSRRSRR